MTDQETKQQCLACGGHFIGRDGITVCDWCDKGWMTMAQRAVWLKHRSGPHVTSGMGAPTPNPSSSALDVRRATFMARVHKAWEKKPALSFVEFVYETLSYHRIELAMLPMIDDKRFAELCERFALLGP